MCRWVSAKSNSKWQWSYVILALTHRCILITNIRRSSGQLLTWRHMHLMMIWLHSISRNSMHLPHYNDVVKRAIASQITSLTIVYSTVYSGADQRKNESSASLAFVRSIHRGPMDSPHKWPVTRKMFPFDDVIMIRLRNVLCFLGGVSLHLASSPNEFCGLF